MYKSIDQHIWLIFFPLKSVKEYYPYQYQIFFPGFGAYQKERYFLWTPPLRTRLQHGNDPPKSTMIYEIQAHFILSSPIISIPNQSLNSILHTYTIGSTAKSFERKP